MKKVAAVIVIAIALAVAAWALLAQPHQHTITCAGSTSVEPLMRVWAAEYMKTHSGYRIDVSGGGSGKGIQQVAVGAVDIGMHSRPIIEGRDPSFNRVTIAVANDGVVVVVNKNSPVAGLSKKALQAVFNYPPQQYPVKAWIKVRTDQASRSVEVEIVRQGDGTILLRGDGFECVLQPYVRAESSGTAETFAVFLYGSWEAKWSGLQGKGVTGNAGMVNAIASDEHGIGFIARAFFDPAKMSAVEILNDTATARWNGYEVDENGVPTNEAIMIGASSQAILRDEDEVSGGYPIARELYVSINLDAYGGKVLNHVAEFLKWCLSSEGQQYVDDVGYVPLNQKQVSEGLSSLEG